MIEKNPFLISDATLDRREDVYAYAEFGKIVNRYVINDEIFSVDFWKYLKDNYSIKPENTTIFCDIHSDVKNRTEKTYKYIIKVEKPFTLLFQFYDEEKVVDSRIYETETDQKNKISGLMVYFGSDAIEHVEKFVEDIKNILYQPEINKTFFIISSSTMGYELRAANIKEFDVQLDLNYGESFVDKYNAIVGKLRNNKHGLFLFHGEPGCGKTMLLRKLVSELSEDKTIIYVPSYLMFDMPTATSSKIKKKSLIVKSISFPILTIIG